MRKEDESTMFVFNFFESEEKSVKGDNYIYFFFKEIHLNAQLFHYTHFNTQLYWSYNSTIPVSGLVQFSQLKVTTNKLNCKYLFEKRFNGFKYGK